MLRFRRRFCPAAALILFTIDSFHQVCAHFPALAIQREADLPVSDAVTAEYAGSGSDSANWAVISRAYLKKARSKLRNLGIDNGLRWCSHFLRPGRRFDLHSQVIV